MFPHGESLTPDTTCAAGGQRVNVSSWLCSAPQPHQSRVVVLLLGEQLSGKSSAGNTILGTRAFHKNTTRSSRGDATVCGAQVTVVDTPGWLSHAITPDRVSVELSRGLALCQPEPHVILLVLPSTSTFGREEWRAMEVQIRQLQIPIWQRAMVLFTHGDQLGGLPIQELIRRQGRTLQWLLERCGNRYQVLGDRPGTSGAQVSELFEKIQKVMEANKRPKEIRDRMYTQLRREVSLKEARRSQGGRGEMEMTVMHDGMPGRTYVPRGFPVRAAGRKPPLSLVLLGRRRSGKSSAGNMILDRKEFRMDVKTTRCSVGRGDVSGWAVTVVDTPGWSRFGLADPKGVRAEMVRSPALCPAGSRVSFLLAVPVDSFRETDRTAVETYVGVLGDAVWRSTVVVFTYGEELGGRRVEEHVEQEGRPLQWLLDRCGRRYQVLDSNPGDRTRVDQLLEMVEQL